MIHRFSERARLVFEAARREFKSKVPKLANVTLRQVDAAAKNAGLAYCETTLDKRKVVSLSRYEGVFYLLLEFDGKPTTEWPVTVEFAVHQSGTRGELQPIYQLILLLPDQGEKANQECQDALFAFLHALTQVHCPELSFASIHFSEPLEQDHSADGICWFCVSELTG